MLNYGGQYFANGAGYATINLNDRSTWNVARSVIMTEAATIGKSRPRARIVTTGGDYRAKHRAKKANQFCAGWASECDLYEHTYEALIDSMSSDLGAVQLLEVDGKVIVQRVFANELSFDAEDAQYGEGGSRTMYRQRWIARDVVNARWGKTIEQKAAIAAAESNSVLGTDDEVGSICVREAWHLPRSKTSGDGRHTIAVSGGGVGAMLFDEEWKKTYFPIVLLRYENRRTGSYGLSLMEQLELPQTQLNTLLLRVEKGQRLFAVPRIGIERGSKIVKDEISNLIGGAIVYTKTPPIPLVWPAIPAEVYKWIGELVQKMYDLPGVSRNAASGVKETGTTSGEAIRESLDVQAGRHETFAQRWERFHVKIFRIALDMIADIVADGTTEEVETKVRKRVRVGRSYAYRTYKRKTVTKRKGRYEVKAGKQLLEPVDWAKLGLDQDNYEAQIYPVSNLPNTPQGRLDYVKDMLDAGLWDLTRAKLAMDDLDVDSADDVSSAMYRLLQKEFEEMLYEGVPAHPDELTPYDQILQTGSLYLALGKLDECPPKHIGLVMRYLDEAKAIQKAMAPAPAPVPTAMPTAPQPAAAAPAAMAA
jgi:hypothetical protein